MPAGTYETLNPKKFVDAGGLNHLSSRFDERYTNWLAMETAVETIEEVLATKANNSAVGAASGIASLDENGHVPSSQLPADNKIDVSQKGAPNGVAELDEYGKVPSSQLPSYVDDVLEFTDRLSFPLNGESDKIYIDLQTNRTYRWSGTVYVEISASLAIGETENSAYRGDYGAAAYAHAVTNKGSEYLAGFYKIGTNAEGHVVTAIPVTASDIEELGVSGGSSVQTTRVGECLFFKALTAEEIAYYQDYFGITDESQLLTETGDALTTESGEPIELEVEA